ncbi:energy transducer TonB [Rhodohalobacter sulfatireducens]|uniref:Energy transducer TonB n=1 Tax=Rhodohalobacter sulfatireducens TaxID=2911366 RepID=A0ABS9K848_9BACT|nr:energy transducer TonB [Rhodohalobacter sulfatireducens]MCG2587021.1 energy transducer TonB [Rhodohalobacter sulfatireducens]MDR9363944.1 energy transducer TonB [Balneolaceae bacterium]MDR9408012.1 energy transducer TonB [Balneolaceae bacterium]
MEDKRLKPDHKIRTEPKKNLRNYYTIFLEIGLIGALLISTVLTKIHFAASETELPTMQEQEVVEMEEIVQTKQVERVPPPPRPPVPVAVPNDEIIEDVNININSELDFDTQLDLPPAPPKQADEEGEGDDEEDFFVLVEQMPELVGGISSLQKKIKYPENAIRANIEGRVYVQFIVNEKGEVENPRVIRGIGGGCDEEALRVVKQAKFKPGLQRGRPVRVQFNLPVIFRLQS